MAGTYPQHVWYLILCPWKWYKLLSSVFEDSSIRFPGSLFWKCKFRAAPRPVKFLPLSLYPRMLCFNKLFGCYFCPSSLKNLCLIEWIPWDCMLGPAPLSNGKRAELPGRFPLKDLLEYQASNVDYKYLWWKQNFLMTTAAILKTCVFWLYHIKFTNFVFIGLVSFIFNHRGTNPCTERISKKV